MAGLSQSGFRLDGEKIARLRRHKILTQEEFAERAGISRRSLCSAEASNSVGLQSWRRISDALEVEPDELLPVGVSA